MKKLILLLALPLLNVGCDKINNLVNLPDTLKSMNSTMGGMSTTTGDMNSGMKTTNKGIHKQTLKFAMDGFNDKNNWDEINPVPFKLMPFGQAFGEEATASELMDYFFLTIQEITESKLDASFDYQTGESKPYIAGSPELSFAIQEKIVKLTILSIIAGFVPQDLVAEIISKQIVSDGTANSGRYRETAIAFLALRAKFLNDVMLVNKDLAKPLSDIGMVEEAVSFAEQLDFILKMPNAHLITAVVKPQLHVSAKAGDKAEPMDLDISTTVDVTQALSNWKTIRTGIDKDLKVGEASVGVSPDKAAAQLQSDQQRLSVINAKVNSYIKSWTAPH